VTLAEVQTEMQSVESTIAARRREKEQKEKLRNQKVTDLTKAKEDRNKVVAEKLKITGDLQNREAMEQQKKDLEADAAALKTAIQELNRQLPKLRDETSSSQRKMTDLKQKRDEHLQEIEREKNGLIAQKDRVQQLNREIQAFSQEVTKFQTEAKKQEAAADSLEKCQAKLTELNREIEILQRELNTQQVKHLTFYSCILYLFYIYFIFIFLQKYFLTWLLFL
jgi:chromosome segregation ATPase